MASARRRIITRFGIEEEFMLLDRRRLAPVGLGERVRRILGSEGSFDERLEGEFLAAQLEYATAIHTDLRAAGTELRAFRTALATTAQDLDAIAVGTGTPFDACDATAMIADSERYRRVAEDFGGLVVDHQVNGLHVHVEVGDREAGVLALNGVRLWLPCLLALTGNSPFWRGLDSGFASWRSMILRRLPTNGCPPAFADADDYLARAGALVTAGAATDLPSLAWAARLSERFPTVEVRVFDAQLTVDDTLFAAALTRSLVATALRVPPLDQPPPEILDGSLWLAARDGMGAELVDPVSRTTASAWAVTDRLVEYIRPALDEHGDRELVDEGLARLCTLGTGALRQVEAFRRAGPISLRGWYLDAITEGSRPTHTVATAEVWQHARNDTRIDTPPRVAHPDEPSTVAS